MVFAVSSLAGIQIRELLEYRPNIFEVVSRVFRDWLVVCNREGNVGFVDLDTDGEDLLPRTRDAERGKSVEDGSEAVIGWEVG